MTASTVPGMTANTPARTRMPGSVMTAAILLGTFGCLLGAALLLLGLLQLGDAPTAAPFTFLGAVFLAVTIPAVIGLAKAYRGAQIVAIVLGGIWCLGSMASIVRTPETAVGGLLGVAVGAAIALLVVAPESAREWFAR